MPEIKGVTAHRRSVWASMRCAATRIGLAGLCGLFRFDAWHVVSSYACRPYKKTVVELVNSVNPQTVVEVGCGLGDILSRTRAVRRFGIDSDCGVIRAARLLHPCKAQWTCGDAACVQRVIPEECAIDCLIMVNWIHNLSAEQLTVLLMPLLPRVRYLVVDAIDGNAVGYRFKHDFSFLAAVTERVSVLRPAAEPRDLILFRIVK